MKLNKRALVLVLPVLLVSFLSVAIGLYFIERSAIYSLERSSVELETTELAGIFSKYDYISKGFLASFTQSDSFSRFLRAKDERLKFTALSGGLDSILKSITDLSTDRFAIALVKKGGEIGYYYENSFDPFSEPDPEHIDWVTNLLETQEDSGVHYFQNSVLIAQCRVLDSMTLKSPVNFNSSTTIAMVAMISVTEFQKRKEELEEQDNTVTFWQKKEALPPITKLEARKEIVGFGTLSIEASQQNIDETMDMVLWRLFLGFIVLTVFTSAAIQLLLRRYVTGPVSRLEESLSKVDFNNPRDFTFHHSTDEIGSLSRTFETLYNKLQRSFKITKELAEKDSLTSLYNRRIFEMTLNKVLRRAERTSKNMALIYIDIDNFKYVNDTFGHTTGDLLLQSFAFRLHEVTRGRDLVFGDTGSDITPARLAGDEFAVIVAEYDEAIAPDIIAKRILSICDGGLTVDDINYPVSLSIGVAVFPEDGDTAEGLIVSADTAMYDAKKSGKNCISFARSTPKSPTTT